MKGTYIPLLSFIWLLLSMSCVQAQGSPGTLVSPVDIRSDYGKYDINLLTPYEYSKDVAVTGLMFCGDSTFGPRTMSYVIYVYGD